MLLGREGKDYRENRETSEGDSNATCEMDRKRELTEVLKEQRGGRTRRGSTGCIEDMWKRKREEEEEREGFSMSNKTEISGRYKKRKRGR